ncbi:MAG: hypothetical protein ACE5Q6_02895, partial [Dehalococcoidia bacterium]
SIPVGSWPGILMCITRLVERIEVRDEDRPNLLPSREKELHSTLTPSIKVSLKQYQVEKHSAATSPKIPA